MTPLMQRSIEDAIRYADGLNEALDQIYELSEGGERVPAADMKRIQRQAENNAMHEAFAEVDR